VGDPKSATTCQLARMCLAGRSPDAQTGTHTARLGTDRSGRLPMAARFER
jgi:hypothetical protein